jgi:elongation factor Ts
MADISAALVKELREKTGAGMMDCKRALAETAGRLDDAVDWLRKKGLASAAKKSGRVAAEGLVAVESAGPAGAIIEINSETDFVARNAEFQAFVAEAARIALASGGDADAIRAARMASGATVADGLTNLVATIGENISIRRASLLRVREGVVAGYMHAAAAPGLGRIGVLVALESGGDKERLRAFGRQIAMHIAAANPQWLEVASVDPAALQREREVLAEQARTSGKPEDIVAKMVEGRLRKFYEETVLTEQIYVIDGETKVGKAVSAAAREIGAPIKIGGFVRYALGEGIERKQENLVEAVASTLGQRP